MIPSVVFMSDECRSGCTVNCKYSTFAHLNAIFSFPFLPITLTSDGPARKQRRRCWPMLLSALAGVI